MTLVNGKQQTQIDVTDRGLAYGDGLFETIAYVQDSLHNWDLHWQRFKFGAHKLAIKLPEEAHLLKQIAAELNASADVDSEAVLKSGTQRVIKVIITRGQGGRGYLSPQPQQSSVIVSVHPWPEKALQEYQQGIHATVCQTCLAKQPALAGIKHLNRLEQVLGRNEFHYSAFQEGIMLACSEPSPGQRVDGQRADGQRVDRKSALVVEGTSSNIFFVSNGQLLTPKIDTCGVRGTIREAILSLAPQLGIAVQQDDYFLQQLKGMSEVFFTNSVYGIVPVASITISNTSQWHYSDRTITTKIAAAINHSLQRPQI